MALDGAKTVKVLAQDSNGLSSGWATLSFTCNAPQQQSVSNFNSNLISSTNGNGNASNLPNLDLRVVPSLVRSGDTTKVNWSASNVQSAP